MKGLRSALIAAAIALPGSAMAAPSVLGPNGYIFTPDGFTTPGGCIAFGYHHADGDLFTEIRTNPQGVPFARLDRPDVNAEVLNIGIGNRLEIGATAFSSGPHRLFVNGEGDTEVVGGTEPLVNAKLSLLSPRSPIQVVGGVIDALDYVERTPYVYGSFNFGPMIHRLPLTTLLPRRIQVGAGWATGMIEGAFVNAGLPVTPNLELMFEWLDNDIPGVYGLEGRQINIGGRFRFHKVPGLAIDMATTDFDAPLFGVSYTYCRLHRHKKHTEEEGGEEKGEPKGEPKGEAKPGGQVMAPTADGPLGLAGAGAFRTIR